MSRLRCLAVASATFAFLAAPPAATSSLVKVPAGRPCGAVPVPVEPSMFGYGPTVGAHAIWTRRVSCRSARRLVRKLVAGRAAPAPWACTYVPYNPITCRSPGGARIETLTVSDGR